MFEDGIKKTNFEIKKMCGFIVFGFPLFILIVKCQALLVYINVNYSFN